MVESLMPLGIARIGNRGAAREADIVDQDIESTESLDRSRHDRTDAINRRQVGGHRQHPAVVCRKLPKLARGFVEAGLPAGADSHAAALLNERRRAGQSEPAARTGHDGYFTGQF